MWQLVINGPGYFDTAYDCPEGITHVGRADENDVVLSGDLVSRKHCRFHVKGEGLVFEDLGSRNGTRLNGEPVFGTVKIGAGDVVTIGENTLTVRRVARSEQLQTEMVDAEAGGQVKRFGRGVDIREAVMFARDIKESSVLKALDNFAPFDLPPPPVFGTASDTDDSDGNTGENPVGEDPQRVAVQSLVLLYRVAECLARAPSLQAFLDETCDLVMKRVGATTGVVLLRHASGVMVPAAVRHGKKLAKGEVPVSEAVLDAALRQGQAIAVANVQDDSRFAARESVVLYGIDQVLCIPVGQQAPFRGVLYLNRNKADQEPVDKLLDVCTAITQLIETGIEKFDGASTQAPDERLKRGFERLYAPDIAARRLAELRGASRVSHVQEFNATVLCAEVAGLTAALPKLGAERVSELVTEWQRLATQLLLSFEAALDVVSADGVRAAFGVPYGRGDDAIRAVRAALALKAEWEKLSAKRPPRERLLVRVGLTTGRVFAGALGSDVRIDPALLGEPVQVAQGVAQAAEPGQVLITGKTLAHVGARFDVTPLGERQLPGLRLKTALFDVLDEDSDTGTLSGVRRT
jgi:class 3 adenylate cyclase